MTQYSMHLSAQIGETSLNAAGLFALSEIYAHGTEIVAKDPVKAVDLLMRAANLGHAAAQAKVGIAYFAGEAVTQDIQQALHYLLLAAAQNDAGAKSWLGWICDQSQPEVHYATARRSETTQGMLCDFTPAAPCFELDDQARGLALCHLAGTYEQGLGVEQDYEMAATLYERAAAQGIPAAMYALANLYRHWPWCAA